MKRKWTMLLGLLIPVLLSGCAMGIYPKGATEDYKSGYKDGLKAGEATWEGVEAGMTAGLLCMPYSVSLFTPSKLPDKEHKKIQGEPAEYQRGFADGWVHSVECDADFSVCYPTGSGVNLKMTEYLSLTT